MLRADPIMAELTGLELSQQQRASSRCVKALRLF
jgi:hypothetical protein